MGHIPIAAQQHSLLEEEYLDTHLSPTSGVDKAPADPAARRAPWIKGASGAQWIKGWMGPTAGVPENGPRFLAHPNRGLVTTHWLKAARLFIAYSLYVITYSSYRKNIPNKCRIYGIVSYACVGHKFVCVKWNEKCIRLTSFIHTPSPPTIPNFIIIRPAVLEIKHTDGHSESCSFLVNNSQTCKIRSAELHYKLKSSAGIISIQ